MTEDSPERTLQDPLGVGSSRSSQGTPQEWPPQGQDQDHPGSTTFQDPSGASMSLQKPPRASRALQDPPGPSKTLQDPPGPSRTLQDPPGPSRTLQDPGKSAVKRKRTQTNILWHSWNRTQFLATMQFYRTKIEMLFDCITIIEVEIGMLGMHKKVL
jgi:hypothetical protein